MNAWCAEDVPATCRACVLRCLQTERAGECDNRLLQLALRRLIMVVASIATQVVWLLLYLSRNASDCVSEEVVGVPEHGCSGSHSAIILLPHLLEMLGLIRLIPEVVLIDAIQRRCFRRDFWDYLDPRGSVEVGTGGLCHLWIPTMPDVVYPTGCIILEKVVIPRNIVVYHEVTVI